MRALASHHQDGSDTSGLRIPQEPREGAVGFDLSEAVQIEAPIEGFDAPGKTLP
jgi:hypothetical protein